MGWIPTEYAKHSTASTSLLLATSTDKDQHELPYGMIATHLDNKNQGVTDHMHGLSWAFTMCTTAKQG